MKVRELQQHLSKVDPELELLCYSEDADLVSGGRLFRLFDIESIAVNKGEKMRLDDGTPYLKLGDNPSSVALVILEVTSDF